MQIGILGTGIVGQTLAAALAERGHSVTIGTRDPGSRCATRTRSENSFSARCST
jgi:predicted dinucleotide-binding enzyme